MNMEALSSALQAQQMTANGLLEALGAQNQENPQNQAAAQDVSRGLNPQDSVSISSEGRAAQAAQGQGADASGAVS